LGWRRAKLAVAKFAGVEIRRAARREEEDEVMRSGERMKGYRGRGLYIDLARRFVFRI
jgi:hypothetical protein